MEAEPRPAELARKWIDSLGPSRKRARSQAPDQIGQELLRQVLARLIELDPDADRLESALMSIVADAPEARGPILAMARYVAEELTGPREWDFAE